MKGGICKRHGGGVGEADGETSDRSSNKRTRPEGKREWGYEQQPDVLRKRRAPDQKKGKGRQLSAQR